MPSVDVAMARSLRGGVWGSIAGSLDLSLAPRDLSDVKGKATDAATAFSSWDNCMQSTYCKWPVIAIIIVGSLILLSILWCIIRCACCGLSCCCECCYCLKCCGNCMGCCDTPRGKRHKYLDNETVPPSNYGYRPEPPMKAPDYGASRAAPSYEPPQYAEFDTSRKGGEDSLPSMPTWEQGSSRKVALEEDSMEMNSLNRPANGSQSVAASSAAAAASAAAVAAAAGASSPQRRPIPYRHASPMGPNGNTAQDPYATSQRAYNEYDNGAYGSTASQSGGDQYGAVAAVPMDLRKPSPRPEDAYNRQNGHDAGQAVPDYAQTGDPYFAPGARQPSPASVGYAIGRTGHSPAPPADYGHAQQQYGSAGGYGRTYAEDHGSLSNSGGFDFNSGYSRSPPPPQTQYGYDSPYDRRGSPATLTPNNGGFSAYTPYTQQPQQRGGW